LYLKEDIQKVRFKILLRIVDAPSIIKKIIPQRPAYGYKMLSTDNESGVRKYTIDTNLSPLARRVMPYVWPYTNKLIFELGFVLEGRSENELPERPFGTARLEFLENVIQETRLNVIFFSRLSHNDH